MSRSIQRRPALRKPLAIASALALSAGVALAFAPTAGAAGTPACEEANILKLAKATGGHTTVTTINGTCYVLHYFDEGHIGDSTFTITSANPVDVDYLIAGGGGGGGGGSGWADDTKVSGNQPNSGAGAGGAGGEVKTGTSSAMVAGEYTVTVGAGGTAGAKGTSTAGSTVGRQGGNGSQSSFNSVVASGGAGGFGGTGIDGVGPASFSPVAQTGVSADPRSGGQYGGNNGSYVGGTVGSSPEQYAAPGGAGAGGNGGNPESGFGGAGGVGVTSNIGGVDIAYGGGGGGGTLDPGSKPYALRLGGIAVAGGGNGNAIGNGMNAVAYRAGGGGGGNTDGSVTIGDSNAGIGGTGGAGQVILRYVALAAPVAPAAPSVVAGDSQVTVTITPLAETPDVYTVFVVGDPSKSCEITPPETSCVIDGLTNGTNYTFTAVAGNAAGESAVSDPSEIGTPSAPTTTTTEATGELPYTGSDSRGLASIAVVMVALGGAVTLVARRRRSTIG
jgi:hypothetical protein